MHTVLVSGTFKKQFKRLDKKTQKRVRKALKELETDPIKPRSGAAIEALLDTRPQKQRLRVGDYRIIYRVEKKTAKVIEIFTRGRGYRR